MGHEVCITKPDGDLVAAGVVNLATQYEVHFGSGYQQRRLSFASPEMYRVRFWVTVEIVEPSDLPVKVES